MIKAVIFDCFGVLVRGSLEQFVDKHLSHSQELVQRAYELNDRASLGMISYEQQLQEFADMARLSSEQTHAEMDNNPANEVLLRYIREVLKPNYRIGFLSNASDNWLDDLFSPDEVALFDDVVLSCDVRLAKPDKGIYEVSASKLGVEPAECVFVDDIERYCSGAKDAGMQAIWYKNFGQMKQELEQLLNHSNTDE